MELCPFCIPGIFIWSGVALGCADGVCARLSMPGIFINICGEAEGCVATDEAGFVELDGICIPGMDISIFSGCTVG